MNAYLNLGEIYLLSNVDKAFENFKNLLEIANGLGDTGFQMKANLNLGLVYRNMSKRSKAIEHYQKALGIALELKDKHVEGAVYGNLGSVYSEKGDYNKAVDYLKLALDIYTKIESKEHQVGICSNLGIVYKRMEKYHEAIKWQRMAISISSDKIHTGQAYGNLGNMYGLLGQYSNSVDCFTKSLEIARKAKNRLWEGKALMNIGMAYLKMDDELAAEAEKYFQDGLEVASKTGDTEMLASAYVGLGKCKIRSGDVGIIAKLLSKKGNF